MRGFGYDEGGSSASIRDIHLWRRTLIYARSYSLPLVAAVLISLLITGTTLSLPHLTQRAIDGYITNSGLAISLRLHGLTGISGIFLFCIILTFCANFSQMVLLEWVAQSIMHRIRQDLFRHLMRLDLPFFDSLPTGRIVTRLTNDIQNMHEMFTSVLVTILNDVLRIVGVFAILFLLNDGLALVMSLFIPLAILITWLFARLARDKFRRIRSQLARLNAFLAETVAGIATLQLFNRQRQTVEKEKALSLEYLLRNLAQIKLFAIFMPLTELMSATAIALILWYGGKEILKQQLTLGELVAFFAYMRLFFQPLRDLAQKFSVVQSAMASAERIFELFDSEPIIREQPDPQKLHSVEGRISFNGVTFGYSQETPVIKDLTLEIRPGETVALVGTTGSGKSTLVNLLLRFYDPQRGTIAIDGVDIASLKLSNLRQTVGVVLQDILILNDTLLKNITLDTGLARHEVEAILEQTGMSRFVGRLPQGLETILGDGGQQLSTGEKQLLSFTRVLCRRPSVLILDEATAAIDTISENILEQAVASTFTSQTSLVIAHRLSTIRRVDRILVMDHGVIVEQGSHDELLHTGGHYAELVAMDQKQ